MSHEWPGFTLKKILYDRTRVNECWTCRFYHTQVRCASDSSVIIGECRNKPPATTGQEIPLPTQGIVENVKSGFPQVEHDWWCGSWSSRFK